MVCGHARTKKEWPPIHLITDPYPNQEIVNTKRINTLVEEGAVKFHIFQPSGRAIWTVVGRDDEHWGDIELGFCSCKSYYYKTLSNGKPCYHLLCIELAKKHNKFVTIRFHDTEYTQFIKALLSDFTSKSLT
jgi:predicted nucleic acid-binding Zn finger protein